jgi:hypothetical protein
MTPLSHASNESDTRQYPIGRSSIAMIETRTRRPSGETCKLLRGVASAQSGSRTAAFRTPHADAAGVSRASHQRRLANSADPATFSSSIKAAA